jgi:hypothetical protein
MRSRVPYAYAIREGHKAKEGGPDVKHCRMCGGHGERPFDGDLKRCLDCLGTGRVLEGRPLSTTPEPPPPDMVSHDGRLITREQLDAINATRRKTAKSKRFARKHREASPRIREYGAGGREEVIHVRVDVLELAQLRKLALKRHMTLSRYVRERALGLLQLTESEYLATIKGVVK